MSPACMAWSRGLRVLGPSFRSEAACQPPEAPGRQVWSVGVGCHPPEASGSLLEPVAVSGRQLPPGCRLSVVLDLDETLIHTHYQPQRPHDFQVLVPGRAAGSTVNAYVKKRPGVDAFLTWLHEEKFDLSLYTAGTSAYASAILKVLDPDRILGHRYCRDKCVKAPVPMVYWKDLQKVCKDLTRVVLVDNNPVCFHMQPDNGILIKDYFGDVDDIQSNDHELERIQKMLMKLADTPGDVRKILRKDLKQKDLRPLIRQAMEYHKHTSKL
eukprot:gnl/MRDRNA2_/MRDRNA2_131626_c0_seq1.p1 gnl/MRDRNA2_/MRDRNA2_131626_c0~~gnl/MRDRNA2_/MRDRNA2_131626_c0_seq1.p1  ORF type:complete len:269 (-),score=36.43 gnl/MRDRNA2_/MRDRNA2_131626_c0_seq1:321-1127(-)